MPYTAGTADAKGIDVSEFNGSLDMAAIRPHVDFIIIRCGYGGNYSFQDDKQYRANVDKCLTYGIPFGVYLYSYARNPAMARSEAEHALRLLQGLHPAYGVWYDLEDSSLPVGDTLVENCLEFYRQVTGAGFYCGLYASLSWMQTRLNSPRLGHIDRWVAQWAPQLDYLDAGIWQYTDNGLIAGRQFDMNRAFRDYPAITGGEDWTDMTREEVERLAQETAQRVYAENERRYKTIAQVPAWARESVEKVYKELELTGTGGTDDETKIDASHTYIRALYVIAKMLEQ